jgi:arylsulfatase A-like enzyme
MRITMFTGSARVAGGLAVLLLSASLGGCGGEPAPRDRPSVVWIMVDTLRPDHLGCYGYSGETSPAIDRFCNEALVFENCLSHAPETRYSVASMMTGFYPHETGVFDALALSEGVQTLAETLGEHGYDTAAVVSNYVLSRGRGYEQGFDVYDDTMTDVEAVRKWPERIAERTTDAAIGVLRQIRERPLFLWVVFQDPHGPYTPPAEYVEMPGAGEGPARRVPLNRSLSGRGGIPSYQQLGSADFGFYVSRYDGEIRYLDAQFERLMEELRRQGLYDDALIVFTSDHGEGMGEHDYFFAHGENLYASQTRVPLILRWGDRLVGCRSETVQHLDLVPTVLGVLGIDPDPRLRGRDLREPQEGSVEVFSEMSSPLVEERFKFSIVHDGLKLVYTPSFERYELYDVVNDPAEIDDRLDDPELQARLSDLKTALHRLRREDRLSLQAGPPPTLSDEELRKLEALGYLE